MKRTIVKRTSCTCEGFPFCEHASNAKPLTPEEKRQRKNAARRERNQAMRDLGLKRVRGALGGVYWE